jgi:ribonuclease P protein component
MDNSFKKIEHLTGEKLIQKVFGSKHRFLMHPIKVNFLFNQELKDDVNIKVMVSCPKRNFKKAVDRNRIKRLLREAYRLNKHSLVEALQRAEFNLVVTLVFIGNEMPDFKYIENKIIQSLKRLEEEVEKRKPKIRS